LSFCREVLADRKIWALREMALKKDEHFESQTLEIAD
jgi:hypothetical protein